MEKTTPISYDKYLDQYKDYEMTLQTYLLNQWNIFYLFVSVCHPMSSHIQAWHVQWLWYVQAVYFKDNYHSAMIKGIHNCCFHNFWLYIFTCESITKIKSVIVFILYIISKYYRQPSLYRLYHTLNIQIFSAETTITFAIEVNIEINTTEISMRNRTTSRGDLLETLTQL